MTLIELKDKLNKLYFSSGIYPDDDKFQIEFYKDLAFIGIYVKEIADYQGEKIIREDIVFSKTKIGTYRISNIWLHPYIDDIVYARFYADLLHKYIIQEDFIHEEDNSVCN